MTENESCGSQDIPQLRLSVYDHAQARVARVFADFDNVVLAFSGGKDSGVMLNLVLDFMRTNEIDQKITVFHLDYEGQYNATTDYVDEVMTSNLDLINPVRVCLPVAAGCAVSMFQTSWRPWDPEHKDIWVRPMPTHDGVINASNVPDDFPEFVGVEDYKVQERVGRWLHKRSGAKRTAVLVGIRQQESLHRYAAINRESKSSMHEGLRWTTQLAPGVVNAYPIHDWLVEDVWTANAKFGWSYNALYDLFHFAGLKPHQMRVASPFISQGVGNLHLYRVIEPELWAKLVGRVNGANFASIYGRSGAMAARNVQLPPGHTWKSYAEFLLTTLPEETRENYLEKFATSVNYWTKTGGALQVSTADEVRFSEVRAEFLGAPTGKRRYSRPHEVVRFDEYPDELPGVTDFAAVPTWKRFVVTILRNDHSMKYMGFGPTKKQYERRAAALKKYAAIL